MARRHKLKHAPGKRGESVHQGPTLLWAQMGPLQGAILGPCCFIQGPYASTGFGGPSGPSWLPLAPVGRPVGCPGLSWAPWSVTGPSRL